MGSKVLYRVEVDGEVFTRRSHRVYTHAVLARGFTPEFIESQARAASEQAAGSWRYLTGIVARGVGARKYPEESALASVLIERADVDRAQADLRGLSLEAFVAEAHRERFDSLSLHNDWSVLGWCGSYELALARSSGFEARRAAQVVVLPAEVAP